MRALQPDLALQGDPHFHGGGRAIAWCGQALQSSGFDLFACKPHRQDVNPVLAPKHIWCSLKRRMGLDRQDLTGLSSCPDDGKTTNASIQRRRGTPAALPWHSFVPWSPPNNNLLPGSDMGLDQSHCWSIPRKSRRSNVHLVNLFPGLDHLAGQVQDDPERGETRGVLSQVSSSGRSQASPAVKEPLWDEFHLAKEEGLCMSGGAPGCTQG